MRHARRGGMGSFGTILMTATDSPNETREAHHLESMQILAAEVLPRLRCILGDRTAA